MESMQDVMIMLARMDERQKNMDEKIDNILTQTTKTNGRLTYVENERIPVLERWKSKIHGIYLAVAACAVIAAFIIGVILDLTHKK